jgi:hypothetical protein
MVEGTDHFIAEKQFQKGQIVSLISLHQGFVQNST